MSTSIVNAVPKPATPTRFRRLVLMAAAVTAAASGCVGGQIPEVPVAADGSVDQQLVDGRAVWADHCVRCHGAAGDGGRGPKLSGGAVAIKYPNVEVQRSIVVQGLNGKMPGFRQTLTDTELDAVVAFTRDVL